MTEDYVSFETAKLLKEKGFDEETDHEIWYVIKQFSTGCHWNYCTYKVGDTTREYNEECCISMPTLQMAIKWLREKQIFITIGFCDYPALHKSEWIPEVCTHDSIFDEPSIAYSTYEEACETAVKYCLENLI